MSLFDATSNSGYQSGVSTYSWSHTIAGASRFLAVDVSLLSVAGTTVTGITYNGVSLSLIGVKSSVSGACRVECWGLVAPATGSHTIVVTLSAVAASISNAVSYNGVNQSSPTEAFTSAQATNVGAADATVSITTLTDNALVHGALATDDTSVTANQNNRNNVTGALGSGADEDTDTVTTAGATTISYTAVAALATWAIAGYGLKPNVAAFDGTNAGIIRGGLFSAPFSNAGETIRQRVGNGSQYIFKFTGSRSRLRIFADGSAWNWTVDGGSNNTSSPGGSVKDWINIDGVTDGDHTIIMKCGNYVGESVCLEVIGGSPAVAAPTDYTNNYFRFHDSAGASFDGSFEFAAEGYDFIASESGRIKATTTTLRVWCRSDTGTERLGLCVNGNPDTMIKSTVTNTTWGFVTFTGLDNSGEKTYRAVGSRGVYLQAIMPGNGSANTTPLTPFDMDYWMGDSIWRGTGIDYLDNFPVQVAMSMNRGFQINGNPGQTGFVYGLAHKAELWSTTPAPKRAFYGWGMNDQASGTTSTTDWSTTSNTLCNNTRTNLPTCEIWWVGIIPVTASVTNGATYNTITQNNITALADAKTKFIPTSDLTISTGDGTHPNAAGAVVIRDRIISATSADVTNPTVSSASINSAGTTLTIVHSEAVTGVENAVAASDYQLTPFRQLGVPSSSDGGITWTMSCSLVTQGTTLTLRYSDGDGFVADLASNLLLSFSGLSVTNNSTTVGGKGVYPYGCHLVGL